MRRGVTPYIASAGVNLTVQQDQRIQKLPHRQQSSSVGSPAASSRSCTLMARCSWPAQHAMAPCDSVSSPGIGNKRQRLRSALSSAHVDANGTLWPCVSVLRPAKMCIACCAASDLAERQSRRQTEQVVSNSDPSSSWLHLHQLGVPCCSVGVVQLRLAVEPVSKQSRWYAQQLLEVFQAISDSSAAHGNRLDPGEEDFV